jgi:hypothetical protein
MHTEGKGPLTRPVSKVGRCGLDASAQDRDQ